MYVRSKQIKGHTYYYLVKSERQGKKVMQKFVRYVGKAKGEQHVSYSPEADRLPAELQPLAAEARKYKSAEEFVKAQGEPLYHGTQYKIDAFSNLKKDSSITTGGNEYGYGTYLTPNENLAKHYAKIGGDVYEARLVGATDFLSDVKKVTSQQATKIRRAIINDSSIVDSKGVRMVESQKQFIIDNIIKDSKNGVDLYKKIQRVFPISDSQLSQMLDDAGIHGAVANDGKETVIFNPEKIKTKSQLVDLYRRVTGKS